MNLLVPIDDSDPARAAIEHAVTTFPDADITVLHVVDPETAMYRTDAPFNFERLLDIEEEKAETLVESAREIAEERGHDGSLTTEIVIGDPVRTIVSFAEDHGIDQIVVGSHGRSGVSRMLLGSVAEQVVRRASMPVTVAR
ncbi:universal stress protein [Natrialbaceae archaeon GCM10025810]|uniref:universal stress protein n=1 Tax=Halovalidus salilacus TaxID=3075124 RepID=UPI00360C4A5B